MAESNALMTLLGTEFLRRFFLHVLPESAESGNSISAAQGVCFGYRGAKPFPYTGKVPDRRSA